MSRVVVHRRALRYLRRQSRPDRERLRKTLGRLAEAPNDYPGVVNMAGEWTHTPQADAEKGAQPVVSGCEW